MTNTTTTTTTDTEATKILQAARLVALRARPYLARALFAITLRPKAGIGTMACDASWRVYYDPTTVKAWGVQNTAVGLLHELGHLVRAHHARAKALGVTAATAQAANIAQDCAVNEHLCCKGDTFALLATDSTPAKLGLPAGKTWEEYYGLLVQQQQGQNGQNGQQQQSGQQGAQGGQQQPGQPGQQQSAQGQGGKPQPGQGGGKGRTCGSGATGVPEAWEDAPPSEGGSDSGEAGEGDVPGLNPAEARAVQAITAKAVEDHEKKHGRGSAQGWGAWAAEKLAPPVTPWQQVLRTAVRAAVQSRRGAVDFTYSRPSRRSGAVQGVVMPAMHAPIPQVSVVLDTSGSMGSSDLQQAVQEVEGVCRALAAQVRVVTVDAVVQADKTVQSAREIKVAGRGGTDMNVGIRHVVENRRKKPCDVIIVVTDGMTPMPAREDVPRDVRLVYCLIGVMGKYAQPPAWATTVIVPAA
jgi:predicted metal-dependent peptidase